MQPLDRRRLLGIATGAFALGSLGGRPRAERTPPRLRKALKIGMIGVEGSLRERFQAARDAGFEGVELDSPSDLVRDEVLAAKEAAGIEIPGVVDAVHWKDTLGDPDPDVRARGVAALETALRDCAAYGGTTVLLVPAVVNARIAYDQAWDRSIAEIRRVLPLAEELGVAIAIENVWNDFLLSPLEAARYVDQFDSPQIGWYLDVGNVVKYGRPEQWARILGRRVLKLDVKGYSRSRGWVGIGEGDVDWPGVFSALQEIGYTGWASAEVAGGGAERLREISARMDRVFGAS